MKNREPLGKRYRLHTGMMLETWPAIPHDPEVKRIAVLSVNGAFKGLIEFVKEDLQTIIDAFNDAASQERPPTEEKP